jgi:hypothetical protein
VHKQLLPNNVNFEAWVDKTGTKFIEEKPVGKGALCLLQFHMKQNQKRPTFADVDALSNKNFDENQKNYASALTAVKKTLECLEKEDLESKMEACKTQMEKHIYKMQESTKLKAAKQEARLAQVQSVKYIAWKPEVKASGRPQFHDDGTLKGTYVCKYKATKDEFNEVEVGADWAERNVSVVALAYAQQKAYEHSETVEVVDEQGKVRRVRGFVSVENELAKSFVSVENEGVDITFENHNIHKIRYLPGRTVTSTNEFQKDADGKLIWDEEGKPIPLIKKYPEQWQAYSKETRKLQYILKADLLKMTSEKFLEQVKRFSLMKSQGFVNITPGASRAHGEVPDELLTGPPIQYRQMEGQRTCLVSSLSSLLHFVNAKQHAAELFSVRRKLEDSATCWDLLHQYLLHRSPKLKMQKIDYTRISIDAINPDLPIVTCVVGNDCKEDHTVCIYKGWIFDGNFKNALTLNKEALDICCSDEENSHHFERFCNTYTLPYFKQYLDEICVKNRKKAKKKAWKLRKKKQSRDP